MKTTDQLNKEKANTIDRDPQDGQQVDGRGLLQKLALDGARRILPLPFKGNLGFEDGNLNC